MTSKRSCGSVKDDAAVDVVRLHERLMSDEEMTRGLTRRRETLQLLLKLRKENEEEEEERLTRDAGTKNIRFTAEK